MDKNKGCLFDGNDIPFFVFFYPVLSFLYCQFSFLFT